MQRIRKIDDSPQREPAVTLVSSQPAPAPRDLVFQCIEKQSSLLLKSIRFYVSKFGLATGSNVQPMATEILQETVIEAMAHADAYQPTKSPMAWLLGIALNMMRRKRVAQAKQISHELPFSQLASQHEEASGGNEWIEELLSPSENRVEQEFETREQVAALLALVSHDDQQVIVFALLEDFKRTGLAARLGLHPNTAGMRLKRALTRLRSALEARTKQQGKGNTHA